jgi:sigma-54 dependent transcriptional regulator, acetoin dehydrogenase operon transcriptional activator AcoR
MPDPSIMAAAIASKYMNDPDWEISFACDTVLPAMPTVKELLADYEFIVSEDLPFHIDDLASVPFDAVVTFCDSSRSRCPTFSGLPARFHWPLDDLISCKLQPSLECVEDLFVELKKRVEALIMHGNLKSIINLRNTFGTLIEHLTDGVMAHDENRQIFVFNKSAENITGYKAADIIGKDCHKVFPGLFCGGDCSYCISKKLNKSKLRYPNRFIKKDGSILDLEMSVVTMQSLIPEGGALVIFRDQTEVNRLKRTLQRAKGFHGIIGQHQSMQLIYDAIEELSDERVPVLIQGESGVGKELVADALHQNSAKKDKPFVPVNCGALPENILESELFGHVKGSFTGAIRDKKGRFELADGGTLFLDEIGEITASLQVKLLRVLEAKSFMPVGGEKEIKIDVRIVCATNRDLLQMVSDGSFREDLYYRLAVYPITVPPLRDRESDIPLLIEHFLHQVSNETGRVSSGITPEAMDFLQKQKWPGNIRQLYNVIQYAMIKCRGNSIASEHFPPELKALPISEDDPNIGRPKKLTSEIVFDALKRNGGNRAVTARELGIARSTLYRYMEGNDVSDNTKV